VSTTDQASARADEAGALADPLHAIPFLRLLGARSGPAGDGRAELSLELREELLNSWGVGHGGVVMTLLDVAMARAGRTLAQADGRSGGSVTVEMKTTFFRPARGVVRAVGRVLQRSTTMSYCEAELLDEQGALLAKASGTFKYLLRPTVARKR